MLKISLLLLASSLLVGQSYVSVNQTDTIDTASGDQYYLKGEELNNKNAYDSAYVLLKKAAKIYKDEKKLLKYVVALQTLSNNRHSVEDFEQMLRYSQEIVAVCNKYFPEAELEIALAYRNMAVCFGKTGDFEKERYYFQEAEKLAEAHRGKTDFELSQLFLDLSNYYFKTGYYDKSGEAAERALAIRKKTHGENSTEAAYIYFTLASVFSRKGNFDKALLFDQRAVGILREKLGEEHPYTLIGYNNLGMSYGYKGQYDTALVYLKKTLHGRLKLYGEKSMKTALTYLNISSLLGTSKIYDNQIEFGEKALAILIETVGEMHPHTVSAIANLAEAYENTEDYKKALVLYKKAIATGKKVLGNDNQIMAHSYRDLGDLYIKTGQYTEAIKVLRQSLMVLAPGFTDSDLRANPPLDNLRAKIITTEVFILKSKALYELYHQQEPKDSENLKASLRTADSAIALLDEVRHTHTERETKQILVNHYGFVYQQGIQAAVSLFDITGEDDYLYKAFELAEKNKSFLLLETLKDEQAKQFAGIPQYIQEEEQQLKIDLAFYEKSLQQAKESGNREQTKKLLNIILNLKQDYEYLITVFEKNYPKYYSLKYADKTSDIKSIQKNILEPGTLLIEYFVSESIIYAFFVTPEKIAIRQLDKTDRFEPLVTEFLNSLYKTNPSKNPQKAYLQYTKSASELYNLLLPKASKEYLNETVSSVIIVPDGILNLIPFEALLSSPVTSEYDKYADMNYLMKDHTISYAYSATWLENIRSLHAKNGNAKCLAIAPGYKSAQPKGMLASLRTITEGDLVKLPNAAKEVAAIGKYLTGTVYSGLRADEETFKEHSENYSVIHLAGHGTVDNENPMNSGLIFSNTSDKKEDGILYAREIYNLKLNADLVVLSACETGSGKLMKGEGVMSLAKAFSFAGCPATVMSLWAVDDKATSELMNFFYRELSHKTKKSDALKKAKTEYLQTSENTLAHPFYWAGFTLTGNTDPLSVYKKEADWKPVAIAFPAMVIFLLLAVRLNSSRRGLKNTPT